VDTTTQLMFYVMLHPRGGIIAGPSLMHSGSRVPQAQVSQKFTKLEPWCVPSIQQQSGCETLVCSALSILGLGVISLVVCRLWLEKLRRSGRLAAVEASLGYKVRRKEEYKVLPLPIRALLHSNARLDVDIACSCLYM
jgi:hypothetical protein